MKEIGQGLCPFPANQNRLRQSDALTA